MTKRVDLPRSAGASTRADSDVTSPAAQLLANAQQAPVELRIIDLLAAFGFNARTGSRVTVIYRALSSAGLACEPDFAEGSRFDVVRIGVPLGSRITA